MTYPSMQAAREAQAAQAQEGADRARALTAGGVDPAAAAADFVPADTPDLAYPSSADVQASDVSPPDTSLEATKPKIIRRTASDDVRNEIASRFKRDNLRDVTSEQDLRAGDTLYGQHTQEQPPP